MAEKCVNFYSKEKLNCSDCFPQDAVICVPEELTLSGLSTIEVSIESLTIINSFCGKVYSYLIKYDTDLLAEDTELTSAYVEGAFCKDCLTEWIENNFEPKAT